MTGETLLTTLAERRILLAWQEDRLRFRAPEGAIDDNLRAALRAHKDDLSAMLRTRNGFVQLCPLSYNQLSLYFLHLFDSTAPAYNLALTLRLRNPTRPELIQEAVQRLVKQHPQLRTTFGHASLNGAEIPCQFTAEELAPAFIEHEAETWTEDTLRERAQSFYATPIDLENGPVVRAGLFRRATGGDVLILQLHHIAVDGWSLDLIARDLGRHYTDAAAGREISVVTQTETYNDFTLNQRQWLAQPKGLAQLEYWRKTLQPKPPVLELGDINQRPAIRRSTGATRYFEIDAPSRARLEEAATRLGVTPFALLLSTFQAFLMQRAKLNDVTVGVPSLGRRGIQSEDTVGYFVNPIALRSQRSGALSFREHAQRTAQELAAALENRDLPFASIVEQLGGNRDPARTPVFQVLFNLLSRRMLGDVVDLIYPGADEATVNLSGLVAGPFPLHQQEGQFDLTLEFVDRGAGWLALFKYCTDLFTNAEAEAMVEEFNSLLNKVSTSPDTLLFDFSPTIASLQKTQEQIVIAATFTAEAMQDAFRFWFKRLDWSAELAFAPFNQVFQELLNPASLLRRNTRGHNVVFIRCDDLIELDKPEAGHAPPPQPHAFAKQLKRNLDELIATLLTHAPAMQVPLCVAICPSSPGLCTAVPNEALLRTEFAASLDAIQGVQVLTPEKLNLWYPVADWYEPAGEELGHIPYTPHFLTALATGVVRTLHKGRQAPIKAIAIDCDGTLWQGVVGEDGPEGVTIDTAQRHFQGYLIEQQQAGVLLCLCSKNQEADVWSVFDRHPAMVLKREHIAFARINWEPKSSNLQALAAEINIGLAAFAFLDDNTLERAEVSANCPEVLTVDLPEQWNKRVPYLRQLWQLDHARVTEEDRKRSEHYRANLLRADLRSDTRSYTDFLTRLELVVEIRPVVEAEQDRVAQLMVRTNQFNTTVQRLSRPELVAYTGTPRHAAFVINVRDRFGDYGLVGAALTRVQEDTLQIDSLLLSCRSLGRGVEHRIAAYLANHAIALGCNWVTFPFTPTDRNEPARSFLEQVRSLCDGNPSEKGELRVTAQRLATVQFIPASTNESKEPNQIAANSAPPKQSAPRENERFMDIANELASAETIFAALTNSRQQLPRRPTTPHRTNTLSTPQSETEAIITAAWKRILALPDIGTKENFFELGGTSLLIAQLALELRRQGLSVKIVDLFHYPTIDALARNLTEQKNTHPTPQRPSAQPKESSAKTPLPAAFERLRKFRGR